VATTGLVLAPIFHRILHGLHVPDDGDEARDAKAKKGTAAPKRSAAVR
jgi:hypothetical protein